MTRARFRLGAMDSVKSEISRMMININILNITTPSIQYQAPVVGECGGLGEKRHVTKSDLGGTNRYRLSLARGSFQHDFSSRRGKQL